MLQRGRIGRGKGGGGLQSKPKRLHIVLK